MTVKPKFITVSRYAGDHSPKKELVDININHIMYYYVNSTQLTLVMSNGSELYPDMTMNALRELINKES